MKLKVLATTVAATLATAGFASDLIASFAIADGIVTGRPGYVDLPNYRSKSNVVVVQGYPEVESQDEDAEVLLFQAHYYAYSFKFVTLVIAASDYRSAERKANVFKGAADKYALSRNPKNGPGTLHIVEEPISNADAVSLSNNGEIILTLL